MTHDDFLDANTAERLLSGAVSAADAPPGYGAVASVLAAAASPGPVPEMDLVFRTKRMIALPLLGPSPACPAETVSGREAGVNCGSCQSCFRD